jgi:SAM-dependent methyltransferase
VSTGAAFTGERLHAGDELFAVDLARHEAAESHPRVLGLDRVPPDARQRGRGHFVRADLRGIPLAARRFGLVVSFQVIEHLTDPTDYLEAIASMLAPGGLAMITTPNVLMSDGVNPYHVHEYRADELAERLRRHFREVEVLGIGASEPIHRYLAARSRRIRRIMRLDPLRLRERLPRPLVEWLFARFAVLVRRRTGGAEGQPAASWRDFPVGAADARCLDLLALCRQPR